MIQCAVDHEAVTVGNQVSATADVFVESGDEPDGLIEVKLTHEGLIVDVWKQDGQEPEATMAVEYQYLSDEMVDSLPLVRRR